jgi:hypothetical protein
VDNDDEDEGGSIEEWNLLCDLPYVAFRHLLDFLSSCPANAGAAPFFRYLKLLFSY